MNPIEELISKFYEDFEAVYGNIMIDLSVKTEIRYPEYKISLKKCLNILDIIMWSALQKRAVAPQTPQEYVALMVYGYKIHLLDELLSGRILLPD